MTEKGSVFCKACHPGGFLTGKNRCMCCQGFLQKGDCAFCQGRQVFFEQLLPVFHYRGAAKTLLKAAKFEARPRAIKAIATELWSRYENPLLNNSLLVLPSSRTMLNQICKELPVNYSSPFIKASKAPQNKVLHEAERFRNISMNLSLDLSKLPGLKEKQNYIILDDVWTTGATMNYASYLLNQAGIERQLITALVLFRRDRYTRSPGSF